MPWTKHPWNINIHEPSAKEGSHPEVMPRRFVVSTGLIPTVHLPHERRCGFDSSSTCLGIEDMVKRVDF